MRFKIVFRSGKRCFASTSAVQGKHAFLDSNVSKKTENKLAFKRQNFTLPILSYDTPKKISVKLRNVSQVYGKDSLKVRNFVESLDLQLLASLELEDVAYVLNALASSSEDPKVVKVAQIVASAAIKKMDHNAARNESMMLAPKEVALILNAAGKFNFIDISKAICTRLVCPALVSQMNDQDVSNCLNALSKFLLKSRQEEEQNQSWIMVTAQMISVRLSTEHFASNIMSSQAFSNTLNAISKFDVTLPWVEKSAKSLCLVLNLGYKKPLSGLQISLSLNAIGKFDLKLPWAISAIETLVHRMDDKIVNDMNAACITSVLNCLGKVALNGFFFIDPVVSRICNRIIRSSSGSDRKSLVPKSTSFDIFETFSLDKQLNDKKFLSQMNFKEIVICLGAFTKLFYQRNRSSSELIRRAVNVLLGRLVLIINSGSKTTSSSIDVLSCCTILEGISICCCCSWVEQTTVEKRAISLMLSRLAQVESSIHGVSFFQTLTSLSNIDPGNDIVKKLCMRLEQEINSSNVDLSTGKLSKILLAVWKVAQVAGKVQKDLDNNVKSHECYIVQKLCDHVEMGKAKPSEIAEILSILHDFGQQAWVIQAVTQIERYLLNPKIINKSTSTTSTPNRDITSQFSTYETCKILKAFDLLSPKSLIIPKLLSAIQSAADNSKPDIYVLFALATKQERMTLVKETIIAQIADASYPCNPLLTCYAVIPYVKLGVLDLEKWSLKIKNFLSGIDLDDPKYRYKNEQEMVSSLTERYRNELLIQTE